MLELTGIIVLGIFAQWLAWRMRIPAILPLILIGLFVGPISEILWGAKLIEPALEYQMINGHVAVDAYGHPLTNGGLFSSHIMFHFVSLSIGVILFEGGLTLKLKELKGIGPAIMKLITLGSLVTFVGAGLAAMYIIDLSYQIAFLFGGLIIVTGPTVIAPILRNVPLSKNIATVLKWEGILIDPIGALVAVLVFNFIISGESGGAFTLTAMREFTEIICVGFTFGLGTALGFYQLLKRDRIPHYLLNVVSLAMVLGAFALSDIMVQESGLLTVVVMGMVLANMKVPHFKDLLYFKESLTILLISILFILLSANINAEQLEQIMEPKFFGLLTIIILVLRPLAVFLSTYKSEINFKEKLFISWVGPRGIVAAGIASLFGLKLVEKGVPNAELITPMVFLVVLGTVLLNATTARFMAKILNVTLQTSDGVLIIGANAGAQLIGKYLHDNGRHVVLIDRSEDLVEETRELGLEVIEDDIFNEDLDDRFELLDVGYLLALTSSAGVNKFACQHFHADFGENGTFRLRTSQEIQNNQPLNDYIAFDGKTDYINLLETARDFPQIHELELKSFEHFKELCSKACRNTIPLFIKKNNHLYFIQANEANDLTFGKGDTLIYLGKELEDTFVALVED
ncbi:MAG: sodium:proton antiporter [Aureispira sp.]|nr:sodium:proton antiporter [Aureispira sp.]